MLCYNYWKRCLIFSESNNSSFNAIPRKISEEYNFEKLNARKFLWYFINESLNNLCNTISSRVKYEYKY